MPAREASWQGLLGSPSQDILQTSVERPFWSDLTVIARWFWRIWRERGASRAGNVTLRSLWSLGAVAAWHRRIDEIFQTETGAPAPVATHLKPIRRYLCQELPLRARLALLGTHYGLAFSLMDAALVRRTLAAGTAEIGTVAGRDTVFHVQLWTSLAAACHREGEFTIALTNGPMTLARITFLLTRDAGGHPIVVVGGVQGHKRDGAVWSADGAMSPKQAMIAATRSLGGVRPKDAVLFVLRAMAASMGAREILGVSNAMHVTTTRQGEKAIWADYDAFWRDRGAVEDTRTGFRLAIDPAEDLNVSSSDNRRETAKADLRRLGARLAATPSCDTDGRRSERPVAYARRVLDGSHGERRQIEAVADQLQKV